MRPRLISRNVWILSIISLFTDMASEMLYPVMPLYLKEIGFSIVGIGLLEGVAEAVAGLSKGYFGVWSDRKGIRKPFVQWGYGLSAVSKPMMAVLTIPVWIFFARTIDRVGKGLRTGARDALLSDEATPATKGAVFGFHRSMDTLGAMLGPAIALLFLYYMPGQYRTMFVLAFIPGIIAVAAGLWIREKKKAVQKNIKQFPSFKAFYNYWLHASTNYKKLTGALLLFSLVNSSDVFLLLKMKEHNISDTWVIGIYIFYNAVFALLAFPLGKMADVIGFKKILCIGLLVYAGSYFVIAGSGSVYWFAAGFFLYACYAAATEGISKGWISNIVPAEETASAIGTFTGFQSITALLASTITGWLWLQMGAGNTLIIPAVVSIIVSLFIMLKVPSPWQGSGESV